MNKHKYGINVTYIITYKFVYEPWNILLPQILYTSNVLYAKLYSCILIIVIKLWSPINPKSYVVLTCHASSGWVNMREYDLRHTIWNTCLWTVYSAVTALVWESIVIEGCTAQTRYKLWCYVFRKSNYCIWK